MYWNKHAALLTTDNYDCYEYLTKVIIDAVMPVCVWSEPCHPANWLETFTTYIFVQYVNIPHICAICEYTTYRQTAAHSRNIRQFSHASTNAREFPRNAYASCIPARTYNKGILTYVHVVRYYSIYVEVSMFTHSIVLTVVHVRRGTSIIGPILCEIGYSWLVVLVVMFVGHRRRRSVCAVGRSFAAGHRSVRRSTDSLWGHFAIFLQLQVRSPLGSSTHLDFDSYSRTLND